MDVRVWQKKKIINKKERKKERRYKKMDMRESLNFIDEHDSKK